jgi:hypothetical protein
MRLVRPDFFIGGQQVSVRVPRRRLLSIRRYRSGPCSVTLGAFIYSGVVYTPLRRDPAVTGGREYVLAAATSIFLLT